MSARKIGTARKPRGGYKRGVVSLAHSLEVFDAFGVWARERLARQAANPDCKFQNEAIEMARSIRLNDDAPATERNPSSKRAA